MKINHFRKSIFATNTATSKVQGLWEDFTGWLSENKINAALMFIGFAVALAESKKLKTLIMDQSAAFVDLGQSMTEDWQLFLLFVVLMCVRLVVSTLVPPTSPAFAAILGLATPDDKKHLTMPFFLGASTVAGAIPWTLDKLLQNISCRGDLLFTTFMYKFASCWPL